MYKIIISGFLIIVSCGCATSFKKAGNIKLNSEKPAEEVIGSVFNKNLTGTGFFIEKGKIISSSDNGRIGLIFTMKYLKGEKYLISLRSRTGIEAFRIYISHDSVLINDRLKRTFLYGNGDDFQKITGIPADLIKISIGDLFVNKPSIGKISEGSKNEIVLQDYFRGLNIISTIDCSIKKTKSAIISTGGENEFITIKYSRFRDDAFNVPKRIEVNDPTRKISIIVSIEKYSAPWIGEIEFIPGNGYTTRPLI